jgi:hypothetical protein
MTLNKIESIKMLKKLVNCGLVEAKYFTDAFYENANIDCISNLDVLRSFYIFIRDILDGLVIQKDNKIFIYRPFMSSDIKQ